ncbi:MAG: xanthine dehydrogenase small subunit [Bacteroidales bacterium]
MQETIRFVFDDRIVEVEFSETTGFKPTTTVLNFLRSFSAHKGVKEGCAEGDCGACTVVLAEIGENGKLVYKTVDSCLVFLPMIHGKQLITIENLAFYKEKHKILHPVQKMLVDSHGSQCGYCTPGVVMSLFGLFKNHHNPPRETIEDALTGNLCRCTGYQSILEAAQKACSGVGKDHFSQYEPGIIELLLEIKSNRETFRKKRGRQHYTKPFTLEEALRVKKEYPSATVISGSTDVALRQTKKKELLAAIVDLSGVEELQYCHETADAYVIGAGLPLEKVRRFAEERLPALNNILKVFGSLQIRNMATLGGNVGSASPIGDSLPLLISYKASVKIRSLDAERICPVGDFITGYRKTLLHDDELIIEIIIPKHSADTKVMSYKVSKRREMDISTVSAAFRLTLAQGKVSEIILAFGGMAPVPIRAIKTEEALFGKEWTLKAVEEAMPVLIREFTPISDARAEAEFRNTAATNLLLKFFVEQNIPDPVPRSNNRE